ncbi:hypothetical protein IW492_13070 [Enterococcus sp. BWB1-3]|uniref:hypothetical protein n=1 Tax=unclassified Enterococcus TaxID=2608891 RepID=UPI001921C962|nr:MULTISPECIES: hypothetical protein [unclassified Enterococcus]MBL1230163.1 hypothetical protein [Enterococcus sp. BWB1-3]MCB5953163.1 hypothetical protein [Enterococcus sp. BWT-B8]MCB5953795.1 hypothetical protein [Enterococcus sp. CWB-B31]
MKRDRQQLFFILLLFVLFALTNLLLLFFGESPRGILLNLISGLAFTPVEVYATVFFLEGFLRKREEKIEELREDTDYFSIAKEEQVQLIWTIKYCLLENFSTNTYEDVDAAFYNLYAHRKTALSAQFWESTLLAEHLTPSMKSYNLELLGKNLSHLSALELSTEIGNYMRKEITDFYAIYLKFIPLDIFKELHGIYKSVEVSILFSDNAYLLQTKQELIEKQKMKELTSEEYEKLAQISQTLLADIYRHMQNISAMTMEHYTKLANDE